MSDRNRRGGRAGSDPGPGADCRGAGGESRQPGLPGAVRRWTDASRSGSSGPDRGIGGGGDLVFRAVPDMAGNSSAACPATQGAMRPIMEIGPILRALKRNKVGAILV